MFVCGGLLKVIVPYAVCTKSNKYRTDNSLHDPLGISGLDDVVHRTVPELHHFYELHRSVIWQILRSTSLMRPPRAGLSLDLVTPPMVMLKVACRLVVYCAKRFLRSYGGSKLECSCVRKIIDFCRKDMNPRHVLLSTDTLKTWFWRFQKKTSKSEVKGRCKVAASVLGELHLPHKFCRQKNNFEIFFCFKKTKIFNLF